MLKNEIDSTCKRTWDEEALAEIISSYEKLPQSEKEQIKKIKTIKFLITSLLKPMRIFFKNREQGFKRQLKILQHVELKDKIERFLPHWIEELRSTGILKPAKKNL